MGTPGKGYIKLKTEEEGANLLLLEIIFTFTIVIKECILFIIHMKIQNCVTLNMQTCCANSL